MNYLDLEDELKITKEKYKGIFRKLWHLRRNDVVRFIFKFAALSLLFPIFNFSLALIIGRSLDNFIPKVQIFLGVFFALLLIIIFIILFIYLWMQRYPKNLAVRCIIKGIFSIIIAYIAFFCFVISTFAISFGEPKYKKVELSNLPGVYYIAEFPNLPEGISYRLYENRGIYLKEIGITYRRHNSPIFLYGDISSKVNSDFIIRFLRPDDNLYKSAIFYYKPATGELIPAENYNESWGREYDDYEDIMKK